jgi:hypothetical protein
VRFSRTSLLAAAAVLALAAPAHAQIPRADLWATINVCDTPDRPDTVGVRASMPGIERSRGVRMWLRFRVQYQREDDRRWVFIGEGGDSGWLDVGSARWARREAGQNFMLTPPEAGESFRLRGLVTYQWRRGEKVVRRLERRTRSGHPGTVGADPGHYSAAMCVVSTPTVEPTP